MFIPITRAGSRSATSTAHPQLGGARQEAAGRVTASGAMAHTACVAAFEARFAECVGAEHAVAVASGTLALWIALRAHGIGPGDEVITSPLSPSASANVAVYAGARPVFADIEPDTYTLDPDSVRAAITPRTRAIMPAHVYGGVADMDALTAIAREHNLAIIEDAGQAHGAALRGRRVGSFGSGAFSFHSNRNTTVRRPFDSAQGGLAVRRLEAEAAATEGGVLTTNDDHVAGQARRLRDNAIHVTPDSPFHMTELQAAIGLAQLNRLDEWIERRIANASYLSAHLAGVQTPLVRPGSRHVFQQYAIRVPAMRRAGVIRRLAGRDSGAAMHSPRPIYRRPFYRKLGYAGHFPVAEQVAREIVSLPIHPALDRTDLARVVDAVHAALAA